MRSLVVEFIKGLALKSFKVSEELPFNSSGNALYLKNPKRVYVDETQMTTEEFLPVLNGSGVEAEVNTVRVYFSSDSKQQPVDYSEAVSRIKGFKNEHSDVYFRRECSVNTEFEGDLTVTSIEFTFRKLL